MVKRKTVSAGLTAPVSSAPQPGPSRTPVASSCKGTALGEQQAPVSADSKETNVRGLTAQGDASCPAGWPRHTQLVAVPGEAGPLPAEAPKRVAWNPQDLPSRLLTFARRAVAPNPQEPRAEVMRTARRVNVKKQRRWPVSCFCRELFWGWLKGKDLLSTLMGR